MQPVRHITAAILVALVAAACTPLGSPDATPTAVAVPSPGADDGGVDGSAGGDAGGGSDGGSAGDPDDGAATPGDTTGEQDGTGAQPDPDPTQPPAQPDPTQPPAPALTPANDAGRVGTNGPAYLRGDRPNLLLEVDIQSGVALTDSVIAHLSSILSRESNADVRVQRGPATSTTRDTWSVAQLQAAADESRDVSTSDEVVVMQLLVLDGAFEQDGVLGLAFDASTAVVFPAQWSDLTTLLLSGQSIARAVSTHEIGHLLGLVGLAEPPTSNHEDAEHPGHTVDENDVMFWAIETNLIGGLAGVPDDFGPSTRADLAAMRDG